MSEANAPIVPPPVEQQPAVAPSAKTTSTPPRILLVSYPKIVFLYPSFFLAIIVGIFMKAWGNAHPEEAAVYVVNLIFLMVLAVNLVILSFDFPRATSLTVFFALAAVGIALWFLFYSNPDMLPFAHRIVSKLHPVANSTYYFLFALFLGLIYASVLLSVRFDYWEVRPNELLHHHGILSDLERFAAPNLRIDKEINDVFEYWLLRSGRLILHPSNERRAIVLENVLRINGKEQQITRMLGALQVQMRPDSEH
jgi:hypothetical protein